uniref:Uncharacterized protein n=1 Tax=Arundo donax TaxID=35708 RepID=A0A0A9A316_ARUDO
MFLQIEMVFQSAICIFEWEYWQLLSSIYRGTNCR